MNTILSNEVIIAALDLVPGSDGNFSGLCPCHDDSHHSLSVKIDQESGTLLTHCFAGCDATEVYNAVLGKTKEYTSKNNIQQPPSPALTSLSASDKNFTEYKKEIAYNIWHDADFESEEVKEYLKGRGLSGTLPESIRQASLEYSPGSGETYPCMIAEITDSNLDFYGIHKTYLDLNATGMPTKATVEAPRKINGKLKGYSVHLSEEFDENLHLTEGIETGLGVQEGASVPVWAAMTAHNLEHVTIPNTVKTVNIWGDLDASGTGQKFAQKAAERFLKQGKTVYIIIPDVDIPTGKKSVDWLDIFNADPKAIQAALKKAKPHTPQPQFPWSNIQMPQNYSITPEGVYYDKIKASGEIQKVLAATGPLWISGSRINLASRETEVQISWLGGDNKTYSRWLNRAQAFKGSTLMEVAELSGFPVYDGLVRETTKYLALLERSGKIHQELIASKPDSTITPEGKEAFITGKNQSDIIFHPEHAYRTYADALDSKGSFDDWLKAIQPIATKYPIALFAIIAALASPLLRILDAPNFVVDFWGKTSCGKTTLLQILASIWGNPTSLILSWNNTITFTERLASFYGKGYTLFFDDSQTAQDRLIEVITYMLANGCGKGRAKPYSLKETEVFQVVLFATGEKPLTERSYPGAKARVVEINGSPFPNIDPSVLQNMKSAINLNYGYLGQLFIENLCLYEDEELIQAFNEYLDHFTQKATNEIGYRFATYFATIALASDILGYAEGMEWTVPLQEQALNHVWDLSTVEMEETDMSEKALIGIAAWIESNKRHFATPGCQTELQPTYGVLKEKEGFVAIIPHIFKQALRDLDVQSPAAILAEWKSKGFLLFTPGRSQKQVKVEGKNIWCICIELKALYPDQHESSASTPPNMNTGSSNHQILPN